ncbi:S8 family serine peptidase [Tumebacillus sp. ITR2]|uniref:S8 family serine peptidase n=1 Tax=Tumebacillus amylolyticus TaxID=2801339 RepID=A0ABS1J6T4_9BACL|nr:S8 family serine peptidase [Tumebacillus amylolyticus]MBL0385986.1 S8 family serine peptidase [Tumebacillus amylolyticus]
MVKTKLSFLTILGTALVFVLIVGTSAWTVFAFSKDGKEMTAQNMEIRRYLGLDQNEYKEFTGKGVTVAILDSGIEFHNDIPRDKVVLFKDFVKGQEAPYDDYGHGTFIAGIIGANGKLKGLAENSKLVVAKVLDENGKTDAKTLQKGIEWIIDNKEKQNIRVVNISIGMDSSYFNLNVDEDPIYKDLKILRDMGTVIICSAGNDGPKENTILYPALSQDVITVGSVNAQRTMEHEDDTISVTSSRGSSDLQPNKPDLVAMGVDVTSLDFRKRDGLTTDSGSSYSAAIVSGVAAVLIEKYPENSASSVEMIIRNSVTTVHSAESPSQGHGEIYFADRR